MSTDFGDTATTVEEVAIGAAKMAAQVAADPMGAARKQVKGFERKGAPTARKINRRFNARLNARLNAMVPEKLTIMGLELDGKLPEKIAIRGLHLVKVRARRDDLVGGVAKRTLMVFNASFKTIARAATHLEQASELTAHRETVHVTPNRVRRPRRRTAVRRHAA